jgi:hypothetical protein
MIRTSNKLNSGSRKNKKHKFVPIRVRETYDCGFTKEPCSRRINPGKPNHQARVQDITDCWPLAKAGHAFMDA